MFGEGGMGLPITRTIHNIFLLVSKLAENKDTDETKRGAQSAADENCTRGLSPFR